MATILLINIFLQDPAQSSNSPKNNPESKKKEMWVIDKKSKTKTETWFVNKECSNSRGSDQNPSDEVIEIIDIDEDEDSGNDTEAESVESGENKASGRLSVRNYRNDSWQSPKTFEEFQLQLKENLRTKDGAHCIAKDEKNIECICGKIVKVCNNFYWRYMVQKPRIQNGKIVCRGHWFNCEEVKRRGTDYVIDPKELQDLKEILLPQSNPNLKRADWGDREDVKPKRMRTRDKKSDEVEDDNEEAKRLIIRRNIVEILESRTVGEIFIQDGPCFLSASGVPECRECARTPLAEREEILLNGKFTEDESNITCSFYSFRKLRLTKQKELVVAGYLNPMKDPKPDQISLWTPDKNNPPSNCDITKTKYILGLIGDQFCQMVQQERKCLSIHMGANKTIAWKAPVRGVREMCDVCKTTLFNYHWICGVCGMFVCLDCYQTRRGGLVKDVADRTTDDYKWPYCNSGVQHVISNLMLANIIPSSCLIDLAKKLHHLRVRWKIPQFCHQIDEIRGLYSSQDDGFLSLQSVSCF